jgi:hypothetical protein
MLLAYVEKEIKNYIKKNPGCRFIDIVRGTRKSRGIVHRCLEDLARKEEIVIEEIRRRVFRYYMDGNKKSSES